jgi:hypothetical protein
MCEDDGHRAKCLQFDKSQRWQRVKGAGRKREEQKGAGKCRRANRPCRDEGQDSGRSHSGLSTCHPTSPARSRTTPHALPLRTRAEHLGLRRLAGRAK